MAFLAYQLVPYDNLYGLAGWRWVVLIGSCSAVAVWFIRRSVPESPRWLATHGRLADADRIVSALEDRVMAEHGSALPLPGVPEAVVPRGTITEAFRAPYLSRTVMLIIFNVFQTVGFYGFANWVPTLLISQGIKTDPRRCSTPSSSRLASPFGPLLAASIADKVRAKMADRDGCRLDRRLRLAVQPDRRGRRPH